MPRAKGDVEESKLAKLRARKIANRSQFDDIQREAGEVMLRLFELDKVAYNKSSLAARWGTSSWTHIQRMIERAKAERG